jgi:hypothetical protein
MTEGLRITYSGIDLKQLFIDRAEVNEARSNESMDKSKNPPSTMPPSYMDEYQRSFQEAANHYLRRGQLFRSIAERIKDSDNYQLAVQDFIAIDMLDMPIGALQSMGPRPMSI